MEKEEFRMIDNESPKEVGEFLEDRLYEHNSSLVGKNDGRLFSRVIRDENKAIIAGLAGWTWAGACEITTLWVHSEYRKRGLGKRLLQEAEKEALRNSCSVLLVRSYSFQSPFFYERNGYTIACVIDGFPPGNKYYLLVKKLGPN